MSIAKPPDVEISPEVIEVVDSFPTVREVTHCGQSFEVSPFDMYTSCPSCGARIKLRGFSAAPEVEDLFDAFFRWLKKPQAAVVTAERQTELNDD